MALTEKLVVTANESKGYVQITVSTVSLALTTIPDNAQKVLIHIETNTVRIRLDGTAPTAAIGQLLATDFWLELNGREMITKARLIRAGGADALVSVHYFA